jgi:hypothetical protein
MENDYEVKVARDEEEPEYGGFGETPPRHGHPRFYELTKAEEILHSEKNKDYAQGGKPTGNFDRVSAILKLYPGFPFATPTGVALVYMLKQLDAALHLLAQHKEGEVENVGTRLGDISIYAKLARLMHEEELNEEQREYGKQKFINEVKASLNTGIPYSYRDNSI